MTGPLLDDAPTAWGLGAEFVERIDVTMLSGLPVAPEMGDRKDLPWSVNAWAQTWSALSRRSCALPPVHSKQQCAEPLTL